MTAIPKSVLCMVALLTAARATAGDSRLPQPGDWAVSGGGIFYSLDADIENVTEQSAIAGAAFVAVEHYFLPAFSVELGVQLTPEVDLGLFRADDILFSGDSLRANLKLQAVNVVLTGKLYPMRLADWRASRSRVQPFVTTGVGALILPLELKGEYTRPPDTDQIKIELTETVGTFHLGGGVDAHLTKRWALVLEALYMWTFTEPRIDIRSATGGVGTGLGLELRALTVRLGAKFVF